LTLVGGVPKICPIEPQCGGPHPANAPRNTVPAAYNKTTRNQEQNMTLRRTLALAVTAALALAQWSFAQKEQPKDATKDKPAAPKAAPDFSLKDLNGKTHALKDLKGKFVVLEWTNKDCPIWLGRMPTLNETYAKYAKKDIVWLNIDSTATMKEDENLKFMQENKITRPVLVDRDGKVGHAYDARTTPHMFIIDKEGKIAYDGAIDNRAAGDKAVNYVSKALDELLAGKPVSEPKTNPYGCSVKYAKAKMADAVTPKDESKTGAKPTGGPSSDAKNNGKKPADTKK
jgi:peroxiredoxin